ncbi:DUF3108 domain-containing protein [Aquabacterium sp. J223]|uniref:DUF3108 domain-containing protein n=1 Tax=Aquabacterium sp. J223 TaxID=2898431 RepID=UPI0021AD6995|nr:DUF3108 domain-containing protein [Aquabacterium sp. J223]UUX96760.1 DUF3108 domain-containing protein [Aquabacterium sp. J223]
MAGTLIPKGRRLRAAALLLAVVALHGLLLQAIGQRMGEPPEPPPLRRMEAVFTRSLEPAEPPPPSAPPRPRRPPARPAAAPSPSPSMAASAAEGPSQAVAESAPAFASVEASAEPVAPPPETAVEAPPAAAAPAVAETPPFEWPPSTRLDYRVTGDFRGPLDGWARVQWIRDGERYQVQLDVEVGLVASRRMTSDGTLTADGLKPRRYEERTAVMGRERRAGVAFGPAALVLNDGSELALPAGVQDSASQFVQLSFLFTLQPSLLAIGRHVDLPVALPRRLDTWRYEVVGEALVATPFGAVPAWHVRPHRPQAPERAGGVMTAEAWFAPSLQYLPVRIHIADPRGAELDLLIEQPPWQAGPGR